MTANEEDAADLTQEAFLRVWQKLPEFRLQAAFSTWLYRLTTNLCLDFMRGRKRRPTVPLEREDEEQTPLPEPKDPAATPEEAALASEEQRRLRRALAELSPEQRELLALRAVRDLNYAQIAELLGVPEGTVKSRLARAREALRKSSRARGTFAHEARHIDERRLRRCNVRNIYPCSAPIWTARWTRTRKRGCKPILRSARIAARS